MISPTEHIADASAAAEARSALRLTRSVSASWWYTVVAVVLFEVMVVLFVIAALAAGRFNGLVLAAFAVGGLLWCLATLVPLMDYRHRTDSTPLVIWRRHLAPLLFAVTFGIAAGTGTGLWALGAVPVIQMIMLLNWPPGVRLRVVLAATALLIALSVVDIRLTLDASSDQNVFTLLFFCAALPVMTVLSLWWWDVLIRLDRARISEARLAATQERLRVATDVHDLQGHHLQVIALQLELAERLMPQDSESGMEQLRAARGSVDDARQGTRDLATRFRSVGLRDELANAVDLLRAAGTKAEASVDQNADSAPASVLGPVIRETTTNVLRHGGGEWARLALTRSAASWRYEISNDLAVDSLAATDGSGLEGIARRVAEGGGELEVLREDEAFTVVVTVPSDTVPADTVPADSGDAG